MIGRDADLYASGHSHYLTESSLTRQFTTKFKKPGVKTIHFVNTGSFLDGHQQGKRSYAEKMGLAPMPIGYIKATFNPFGDGIQAEKIIV